MDQQAVGELNFEGKGRLVGRHLYFVDKQRYVKIDLDQLLLPDMNIWQIKNDDFYIDEPVIH